MKNKTFLRWFLTLLIVALYGLGVMFFSVVFNLDFASRIHQPGLFELTVEDWLDFTAVLFEDHHRAMTFILYGFATFLVLLFIIHTYIINKTNPVEIKRTRLRRVLFALLTLIYYLGVMLLNLIFDFDYSTAVNASDMNERTMNSWIDFSIFLLHDHNSVITFAFYGFIVFLILSLLIHKKIR